MAQILGLALVALALAGSAAFAATGGARIATLNTWNFNEPLEERVDGMIAELRSVGVDVVALQEVFLEGDGVRLRTDRRIADALGFDAVTAPAGAVETDRGRAVEGLALLSRWPVLSTSSRGLPVLPGGRPRAVLQATIGSPFGAIDVYTTHLSTDPEERQLQVVELYRFVLEHPTEQPAVLLGDFNTLPFSLPALFLTGVLELGGLRGDLTDVWALLRPGDPGATFSTPNNAGEALNRRLDHVYVRGPVPGSGEPITIQTFGASPGPSGLTPSDHLGVRAEIRFTGENLAPGGGGGGGGGCAVAPDGDALSRVLILLLPLAALALRRRTR